MESIRHALAVDASMFLQLIYSSFIILLSYTSGTRRDFQHHKSKFGTSNVWCNCGFACV